MTAAKMSVNWVAASRRRFWAWPAVCLVAASLLAPAAATASQGTDGVTGGTVVGWGANGSGAAEPPAGLDDVISVAAGKVHSVALRADGTVEAWGDPFYGGRVPPGLSDIVAVAAADTHSLFLHRDGTVSGAGWNGYGGLDPPADLGDATAIAAGSGFSLALTADGHVVGWGANQSGQASPPQGLAGVTAIAAGQQHALALRADGTVVGWGANGDGQATPPENLHDVVAIAAGGQHSLALLRDGTVVGWGSNSVGQATPPSGVRDVEAIAAGGYFSLALRKDGTVVGWGGDRYDWGEGGAPPIVGAPAADPPEGLVGVLAIAAGAHHALAVVGPPPGQVASLRRAVEEMNLDPASLGQLDANLARATASLERGNTLRAARALSRFRDVVTQLLDETRLTKDQAGFLRSAADRIVSALLGPREVDLGTLGGSASRATAINGRGMVVGDSTTADGQTHAFLWRHGVMTDLGTLGGDFSSAVAVNDAGHVVGESRTVDGQVHAFLWRDRDMVDLGPVGGTSRAADINRFDIVIGTSQAPGENLPRAVRWNNGRARLFDVGAAVDVNDRGAIAGWTNTPDGAHSVLWARHTVTQLGTLGGSYAFVSGRPALNDAGDVIGYSQTAEGVSHAFLWRQGVMKDLGTLGGASSTPAAISERGDVVGYAATRGGASHAFLWDGGAMRDLGTLGGHNPATGVDSIAAAINDRGLVAGSSVAVDGTSHAVAWWRGELINLGKGGAVGVNARGSVAGTAVTSTGERHAAVWRLGGRY